MIINRQVFITICKVVSLSEFFRVLSKNIPFYIGIGSAITFHPSVKSESLKIVGPSILLWGLSYILSLALKKEDKQKNISVQNAEGILSIILCFTFVYLIFFGFKHLNGYITTYLLSLKMSLVPFIIACKSLIWAFLIAIVIRNIEYAGKWFGMPTVEINMRFDALVNFILLIVGLNILLHFVFLFYQHTNIFAFISDAASGKKVEVHKIANQSPNLVLGILEAISKPKLCMADSSLPQYIVYTNGYRTRLL